MYFQGINLCKRIFTIISIQRQQQISLSVTNHTINNKQHQPMKLQLIEFEK